MTAECTELEQQLQKDMDYGDYTREQIIPILANIQRLVILTNQKLRLFAEIQDAFEKQLIKLNNDVLVAREIGTVNPSAKEVD